MERNLKAKIARADGLPGFAAYLSGTVSYAGSSTIDLTPNQALVLLDVEATFNDDCLTSNSGIVDRTPEEHRRDLVESLMHEFGHSLEEFFDLEFDEDWIEKVVMSYQPKEQAQ